MSAEPIDPAAVRRAVRDVSFEYGTSALMEAQERIIKANAEGKPQEAAFWQQVSRSLQDPIPLYPGI